jgi:palmitoyltransferase
MERRNGLQRPWHSQQVITWVLFAIYTVSYHISITPRLPTDLILPFQLIYSLIAFATAVSGLLVTVLNPVDPSVAKEREAREQSRAFDLSNLPKICSFCIIHTAKSTKHCDHCKKCVAAFDHHCKWVNNCIGGRNYGAFLVVICCLELQMSGFICLGGVVIGDLLGNGDTGGQIEGSIILVLLLLAFAVFLFNGVLILFHIYLRCSGQTTYAFLKHRKAKRSVQPLSQLESSKLSIHMSHDVSLSKDQNPSIEPTFHPKKVQTMPLNKQQGANRQPCRRFPIFPF